MMEFGGLSEKDTLSRFVFMPHVCVVDLVLQHQLCIVYYFILSPLSY